MDPTLSNEPLEDFLARLRKEGTILPLQGPVAKDPIKPSWAPPEYGMEGLGPEPSDPTGWKPPDFSPLWTE